jgi:hypothetical protein
MESRHKVAGRFVSFEVHASLRAVDLTPVAYLQRENDQPIVLDIAEDAVVAYAILPESPRREPWRASPRLRGSSSLATRLERKSVMRLAIYRSSFASCFLADSSTSIFQPELTDHFLQRIRPAASCLQIGQPLLGER